MKPRAQRGKQSGRTQEIQRLIGRSLRAVVNMQAMGERQINIDCDVLQADGGTRTASITGSGWRCTSPLERLIKEGKLAPSIRSPVRSPPFSCGLWEGKAVIDLDYLGGFQGRGRRQFRADRKWWHRRSPGHCRRGSVHQEAQFMELLNLAKKGIGELTLLQRMAVGKT